MIRSTKKKGKMKMNIYLETSSTAVSWNQRNIFQRYYEGLTTVILETPQRFGAGKTSVIPNNKLNHGWMKSHLNEGFQEVNRIR